MLHSLRKRRLGLSRGILLMWLAAWLSLMIQPCVMAAGMHPTKAQPCAECPDMPAMKQMPGESADCVSMEGHRDASANATAGLLPHAQPLLVTLKPVYFIPAVPRFAAHECVSPADPPPLKRFCILQI